MPNFNEGFNKKRINKEVEKTESSAYFDIPNQPESQVGYLDFLDDKIEFLKNKIKSNEELQHNEFGPDYMAFRKTLKLEKSLENAEKDKKKLIKEGIEEFNIYNNKEVKKIENVVKRYPYLNKNENTISAIERINKDIKNNLEYIEESSKPLSLKTEESIRKDIENQKEKINKLIQNN